MGSQAGKSSKNAPAVCMYLLEHSVVILLDDAHKDQVHSVSPFDEEAAAVLCLISNHHRRSPPKKTLCCCKHLLPMPNNARNYSKPRQRENKTKQNKHTHKQNYTTSTKPKTHKSFASCSPAESNFTTTKEETNNSKATTTKRSENSKRKF